MSSIAERVREVHVSRLSQVRAGKVRKLPRRGRQVVAIDDVVPDPANERKTFHGLAGLAESIVAAGGIIEPPTVVPHPEQPDKYLLTTGERRWRAARLAGLEEIPVMVGESEAEAQRRLKSLISNVQREDLGVVELAKAVQAMKQERGCNNRELVSLLGKSPQWIGEVLKVLSLPAEHQQQIMQAPVKVPYESAVQVARAKEDDQKELLDEVLGGASVRQVKDKAATLKQAHQAQAGQGSDAPKKKPAASALSCSIAQQGVTLRVCFMDRKLGSKAKAKLLQAAYEELKSKVL